MTGTFKIEVDKVQCMLRMRLSGFFSMDDVKRYAEARAIAFQALECDPGVHVTLSDVRDCAIQAQDVLAALTAVTNDPNHRARRIAFLTDKALTRRQAERVADGERSRSFVKEGAALAWLLEARQEVPAV